MHNNHAKDLFQLQSELVDGKIEMAVSSTIDRVVDQIIDLKGQVIDLKSHMNDQFTKVYTEMHSQFALVDKRFASVDKQFSHLESRFSHLESRVNTIEKDTNSTTNLLTELRSKVINYSFRGGWIVFAGMVALIVGQVAQTLHLFIK